MGGAQELQGPDLKQWTSLDDVKEGTPLVGHADGEAVLVAKIGQELLAIGATCTHYGGPLGEGLVVGDTVRCPWHHACFSLRSGEPLRAPALNPVACFRVERESVRFRISGKEGRPSVLEKPATRGDEVRSIVIIGAGAAGNAAAEMLRRAGYAGKLTMIDGDADAPYDRPNLSKDYMAGTAPEEWIPLRPKDFYKEQRIDLILGAPVIEIDVEGRLVRLADMTTHAYDRLLLATGADPIRLPIPGAELPHVRYLRSLADSRTIIHAAERAKHAVVMGASFIGLEVSASLRARNVAVTVVAPEPLPLERVLGREVGAFLRKVHEEHGVVFRLERTASRIDAQSVTLSDGSTIDADLVVIGAGVRPSISLAEKAGLALDHGVVVDEHLETSCPGIFAAGDIARWPDPHSGERIRVEHWVVAERQGQAAALNMLGANRAFDEVPFFWSAHYDLVIAYVGHAQTWDRLDIDGSLESKDCAVAYRRADKTLAVATLFRDRTSLEAEVALEQDDEKALRALLP